MSRVSSNVSSLMVGGFDTGSNGKVSSIRSRDSIVFFKNMVKKEMLDKYKVSSDFVDDYIENFLSELLEVYSEKTLLLSDEDDVLLLLNDWLRSLKNYSSSDRKKIMAKMALKPGIMPLTTYRA